MTLTKTVAVAALLGLMGAGAARANPYPTMAPIDAYLMVDRDAEIAMARSAAPPSVAADAAVLVLTPSGYVTAAPGKNGFVCLVERAWFSGLEDSGFWNPKLRGPDCYNRQGARSVLPTFLERTRWALAGATQEEIKARTRAALAAGTIPPPEIGSMNYMFSRQGYLGDKAQGPWHPHLMFYMPPMATADWGADLPGSRVMSSEAGINPYTMFYVPMPTWSDGTPDEKAGMKHTM
jgi:hypothetical protein